MPIHAEVARANGGKECGPYYQAVLETMNFG
jgi:hypothetical protein